MCASLFRPAYSRDGILECVMRILLCAVVTDALYLIMSN